MRYLLILVLCLGMVGCEREPKKTETTKVELYPRPISHICFVFETSSGNNSYVKFTADDIKNMNDRELINFMTISSYIAISHCDRTTGELFKRFFPKIYERYNNTKED